MTVQGQFHNASPVSIRKSASETATIALNGNLSTEIDFTNYSQMVIHMPADWTAAYIGFKVAPTSGGTYQPLFDSDGSRVQFNPTASQSYVVQAEISGALFVKLWSQNGSGSNTAQLAERSIKVDLKA